MDCQGLHGSFMHVYEYAQYFARRGDEVVVSSIFIDDSNRKLLESEGVTFCKVIDTPLDQKYDLVYALHLILFPALLGRGLKYDKAILMSLSSQAPIEMLPPSLIWPQYDMLACVSPEIIRLYERQYKIDPRRLAHVPNHIPLEFLDKAAARQSWNKSIKKICVISNHRVPELAALKDIAPFQLDYYGYEYANPASVTPGLLLNYDAVITIGKTVQYAMGLAVPVYEYDKFGGCGFITLENMLEEEKTNFSGRGTRRRLSAEELLQDIAANYPNAMAQAPGLRRVALKRYAIDRIIDEQLAAVSAKKSVRPRLSPDAFLYCNTCAASIGFMFRALGERNDRAAQG